MAAIHGAIRVIAVNPAAAQAGVAPGLSLADARAVRPDLTVAEADPAADRRVLDALADWCGRYTPWTAVDEAGFSGGGFGGGAGLWLDVSGCAHLFGGEDALLQDLVRRLAGLGFAANAALADTPGAAWAAARFAGRAAIIVPAGGARAALAMLPVAGLRLPPAVVDALHRVGLRRIGDLLEAPRAPLAARFGEALLTRLDQAMGLADEPLSPRRPRPAFASRLAFAEPIGHGADIGRAARHLLEDLCRRCEAARRGVRRLELVAYRTDGTTVRADAGTSRPVRDPNHLERLLRETLERIDAGFGIEVMTLAALAVDPLAPAQPGLDRDRDAGTRSLARLVDRLSNRLGAGRVVRLVPQASHVPEHASQAVPALTAGDTVSRANDLDAVDPDDDRRSRQPRPLALLPSPEPIRVVAPVPDGPPVLIRRGRLRHRIVAAEGPERIGPEWWLETDGHHPETLSRIRDYYRVEDADGRRFWVYREGLYRPGTPPRWYLHGLFP